MKEAFELSPSPTHNPCELQWSHQSQHTLKCRRIHIIHVQLSDIDINPFIPHLTVLIDRSRAMK